MRTRTTFLFGWTNREQRGASSVGRACHGRRVPIGARGALARRSSFLRATSRRTEPSRPGRLIFERPVVQTGNPHISICMKRFPSPDRLSGRSAPQDEGPTIRGVSPLGGGLSIPLDVATNAV
jgi:hypothetical protein